MKIAHSAFVFTLGLVALSGCSTADKVADKAENAAGKVPIKLAK